MPRGTQFKLFCPAKAELVVIEVQRDAYTFESLLKSMHKKVKDSHVLNQSVPPGSLLGDQAKITAWFEKRLDEYCGMLKEQKVCLGEMRQEYMKQRIAPVEVLSPNEEVVDLE